MSGRGSMRGWRIRWLVRSSGPIRITPPRSSASGSSSGTRRRWASTRTTASPRMLTANRMTPAIPLAVVALRHAQWRASVAGSDGPASGATEGPRARGPRRKAVREDPVRGVPGEEALGERHRIGTAVGRLEEKSSEGNADSIPSRFCWIPGRGRRAALLHRIQPHRLLGLLTGGYSSRITARAIASS